jgi:hypothetical protein
MLFAFDYPAPGARDVADLVVDTVKPRWVGLDRDSPRRQAAGPTEATGWHLARRRRAFCR